jgi:hypothetical protein
MMDSVKSPQDWNSVKGSMDPILDKVCDQQDFNDLESKGLIGHACSPGFIDQPGKQNLCGFHREYCDPLDRKSACKKIG